MGSARIKSVRQRIADSTYGGMEKFRKQGHDFSDNIGLFLQNKFNEPTTRSEIMGNVLKDDIECKDEATCGQASRFLKKEYDKESKEVGYNYPKIKETAGTYVGPGAEHSQAVQYIKGKPVVGHEWLELPDESIVDASAGQFINPEHKPLKQRQRFRIIPKESGLHKYYKKDESLQSMIDTKEGREEIKRIRKVLGIDDTATPKGLKQVKLPNGKIVTVPDRGAKSARIQMARERLADIRPIEIQQKYYQKKRREFLNRMKKLGPLGQEKALLKHTGISRVMKNKQFLTTDGKLTQPFDYHTNVTTDAGLGSDVQKFIGATGAVRVRTDRSANADYWMEIQTSF